jgi:hypothetical protein
MAMHSQRQRRSASLVPQGTDERPVRVRSTMLTVRFASPLLLTIAILARLILLPPSG